jgi:hypothetical protein
VCRVHLVSGRAKWAKPTAFHVNQENTKMKKEKRYAKNVSKVDMMLEKRRQEIHRECARNATLDCIRLVQVPPSVFRAFQVDIRMWLGRQYAFAAFQAKSHPL